MTRFSAVVESTAVVPAERARIWAALSDPTLLAELTPLLRRIDADGDLWTWHMITISALGVSIKPKFTERMRYTPETRIDYSHEAPKGSNERAGADGWYVLEDVAEGTRLAIRLALSVELPLPRLAGPAVTRVIELTMQRMGDRFSTNLLRHLGVDPTSRRAGAS